MTPSDSVVLVTGAGGDIGRAICAEFACQGMAVVGTDRREPDRPVSGRFRFVSTDLEAPDAPDRLLDAAGEIHALVNCAGVCPTHPLAEATADSWARTLHLNAILPALLSVKAAERSPTLRAIVNVASVSAFLPKIDQMEYGASKAALVSATRSLAKALGPRGVRVNAVAPGIVDTGLSRAIAEARSGRAEIPAESLAAVPLGRAGLAEEVAAVVRFLASSDASYVTGQTLNVCGGLVMR